MKNLAQGVEALFRSQIRLAAAMTSTVCACLAGMPGTSTWRNSISPSDYLWPTTFDVDAICGVACTVTLAGSLLARPSVTVRLKL